MEETCMRKRGNVVKRIAAVAFSLMMVISFSSIVYASPINDNYVGVNENVAINIEDVELEMESFDQGMEGTVERALNSNIISDVARVPSNNRAGDPDNTDPNNIG